MKGKARVMGLGPTHAVTLAEARGKARLARKLFAGLAYVSVDTDTFNEHGGSLASLLATDFEHTEVEVKILGPVLRPSCWAVSCRS